MMACHRLSARAVAWVLVRLPGQRTRRHIEQGEVHMFASIATRAGRYITLQERLLV